MYERKQIIECLVCVLLVLTGLHQPVDADGIDQDTLRFQERLLEDQFQRVVLPFVENHCVSCHGPKKTEARFDISGFRSMRDVIVGHRHWDLVLEKLVEQEMPPEDEEQPSAESRLAVIDWIESSRHHEAQLNAGHPGEVLARRLSNAEYDYTIRDLTGVDIRPTRDFPVDPANQAGFDNSGESLTMSPGLLKKYLQAARHISEFLVLEPDGFSFAPHPVMTDTDRDRYCVARIVDFYQSQPIDLATYFEAAWMYHSQDAERQPSRSIAEYAQQFNVSLKYLSMVHELLTEDTDEVGPVHVLQLKWSDLPRPNETNQNLIRLSCNQLREYVFQLRAKTRPQFGWPRVKGIPDGSQTFILWMNHRRADSRNVFDPTRLSDFDESDGEDFGIELRLPAVSDQDHATLESFNRFAEVFPDTFVIWERGREYNRKFLKKTEGKGRLLSAGFHSMMGYFRDDQPLYDLILNEAEQDELDRLWDELDFIASVKSRQYTGMLWFERTGSKYLRDEEFDFARPENKSATDEDMIHKLADRYMAKAVRSGAQGNAVEAIAEYFVRINQQIRAQEQTRLDAQSYHLEALIDFAWRAYRRPLSPKEKHSLIDFYFRLQEEDGLSHEQAIRDSVVSILISPQFSYRVSGINAGQGITPLNDYELANRLSYFLWSSMPDQELLSLAESGTLNRPEVLIAQSRRMLQDERVYGLAVEFAANWLDVRRFEMHNAVDRDRFPSFTNVLRQSMFEEPLRYFVDVIQNDRPVGELIDSDYTVLNPLLAEYYGVPLKGVGENDWVRTEVADYHRGGLLPMAVFLTSNSPGLRTSPVKRGYWIARRVLGEKISPPPPGVPELPDDESELGDLTLAQTLALHREHKSCSVCHDRFDSLGLAFENYGPVGEWRLEDLGNRPVNALAIFPGGAKGEGLKGLQDYLHAERQHEFHRNLCKKMLAYALGRTLILSDEPLISEMLQRLENDGYRIGAIVESIVTSTQFTTQFSRTIDLGGR